MKKPATATALASALVLAALLATPAQANTTADYTIGRGNPDLSAYSGPYATLHVDLDPTGKIATFTFASLVNGGNTYLFVDGGAFDLNITGGTSFFTWDEIHSSLSNSLGAAAGFDPPSFASSGSGNADGFGNFDLKVTMFDSFKHVATNATLMVDATTGHSWSDASHVLTPNNNGALFASHIAVCPDRPTCTQEPGALTTGYAAGSAGSTVTNDADIAVPEPDSLFLLAAGLLGLAFFGRRTRLAPN